MDQNKNSSEGTPEVDRDVRVDELWKFINGMAGANVKRTYDEYQNESLADSRQNRVNLTQLNALSVQSIQNALTTQDLLAKNAAVNVDLITKQCIRHNDIAIDCIWDPGPGEESLKETE